MSKILLIKPRFISLEFQTITQPMGLMYLGANLKKAGHELKIHDCALDYKDLHVLKRTMKDWQPDFIGISIIITEVEQTQRIMTIIHEMRQDVPVIFGGPWPSANPDESIKKLGANFVVLGEGELALPELVDAINNNRPTDAISGIASLVDGNIKVNPVRYLTEAELNSLPFPAWDLLNHKLYAKTRSMAGMGRRSYMAIVTSRGCPFQCAYCHQTMGKIFRKRSAESVLSEMEELRFRHGFKEFEIIDDCFNLDRERMHAILIGIQKRLGNVKLHFPNALRSDLLNQEDIHLLKQAGTVSAAFAIETSSPRLQKMIHKNLNIEKANDAIKAAVKAGIFSSGYFMIGFPTETYEEAFATVEFAVRSSLHKATFFIPIPFAGTELANLVADEHKRRNENTDPRNIHYFNSTQNISAMSDRNLQRIFRRAYCRFYLNPIRIIRYVIRHPQSSAAMLSTFLFLLKISPRKRDTA